MPRTGATSSTTPAPTKGRHGTVHAGLDPTVFPTITALRPLLTTGGGDERDAWKLRVIVDGLLARSRPPG
ncbi:hypothetical protein [Actinomycetospora lemnae]|uniref:hypothetical protein n=1 Tax=Actinomycetospora lemnae TaxID=3019891 RepID=UPI002367412E|nr:hypothetical protein [Actinomycetospora sp. DW7H6]